MDREVTYADLKLTGNTGLETSSPPSLPQDVCQRPTWRQFALKLACTGIILLALAIIGLSVSVIFLKQKSSTEKSNVDVQEERNETTERPSLLKCPMHWHLFQEKCLFFSNNHKPWNDSLAHCSTQESSLLLIQNQEELPKGSMQMEVVTLTSRSSQFEILNKHVFISNLTDKSLMFWIGLKFTLPDKKWKWINGSFLNSNILEIVGDNKENSCAYLSLTKVTSEYCDGENRWICQKELKSIRNKGYPDS